MKKGLCIMAGFLMLLVISALIVAPQFILNPFYDMHYRSNNLGARPVGTLDTRILFDTFGASDTGGSWGSHNIRFYYASRYDADAKAYYYAFGNLSEKALCVRSENFAILTGRAKLDLAAGETKYFVVRNDSAPKKMGATVDMYAECGWLYSQSGEMIIALPIK